MNGFYDLPADEYHGDPCETPSLSSTIARVLCTASPRHAWTAHPRLNPDYRSQEKQEFDIGTYAHALLVDQALAVEVVDADDWRTKAAKEAREAAREAGRVPLLAKHWTEVQTMVAAAREQLAALDVTPRPYTDGKAEQTLAWNEPNGVFCRARLDWLRDDHAAIDDFKTTSRSANPDRFSRSLFDHGYDVQAAFYLRGLERLSGARADWRWIVQETQPPYALSVVSPAPAVLELAQAKVDYAVEFWARCLQAGEWPAYPTRVCFAELPSYIETQWLEKEAREVAA